MSHETFALNLCKANAELQLELGRLLLENAQRNLELLQRGAAQGLADAKAGINGLQGAADWQALTRLPTESLPAAVQRHLAESQTLGQQAVQNQSAFASGVQQALVFWLSTVTHRSAESQTVAAAVPDWLKPWARLLPQQGTTAAARKE